MQFDIAITATLLLALIIQGVLNSKRMKKTEMKMRGDEFKKATRR